MTTPSNKFKRFMNHAHGVLTTGKSVAAGVGSVLTSFGTGLAVQFGASNAVVIATLAVGSAATAFAAWEIPYKPFKLN